MPLVMEGRPALDNYLQAVETNRIQGELTTETQAACKTLRNGWALGMDWSQ